VAEPAWPGPVGSRGQRRVRRLLPPPHAYRAVMEIRGATVVLRTAEPGDTPELVRIRRAPEVAARWGDVADEDPAWPFDDEETVLFCVLLDGAVVGMIQYSEENTPQYRHAGIDLFLDPRVHGRGLGRDAVRALARHLVEDLGHHRLVIDPAADNVAAIRCYAAVGFRPVGVMRQYEHDVDGAGWHDGLLMDLLADELC
jgi:RimJ/RimL family protein N-acetyltransferase